MNSIFITIPTSNRSNFAGTLGYAFTPSQDIKISALGRACSAAVTGHDHRMAVWTESGSTLQGQVTITASSPTDDNGLSYEFLSDVITLASGTSYIIGSEEFNDPGVDAWKDQGVELAAGTDYQNVMTITKAMYRSAAWGVPSTTAQAGNYAYIYCNMYLYEPTGGMRNRWNRGVNHRGLVRF